ncbi:MAG: hypothetical protein AAGI03_11435 [Pseudomonadota bacterium]
MPVASPELIALIHVLIALEAVGLVVLLRRIDLGRFIPAAIAFLISGAFLMEAIRIALGGAAWIPLAALLLGALLAHLACLWLAWRALKRPL